MIRQIKKDELPLCLDFIHLCFSTVAEKFGFTKENAPGHNAFMPLEKLENFWNWGFLMYGLFEENQNNNLELIGYFSLSKDPDKTDTYVLHNLCVKPQMRKQGYGKALLDFAKAKVRELGGKILFLDFIDEYKELKEWYFKNGFEPKGTVTYEHLPFTVGFAECFVGEKLFGIPENLSVISTEREGYVEDTSMNLQSRSFCKDQSPESIHDSN